MTLKTVGMWSSGGLCLLCRDGQVNMVCKVKLLKSMKVVFIQ